MAFPTGWGRKHSITIDNTKVIGAVSLTDFACLITLDMLDTEVVDAGSNAALNGGGDLRFSSDSAGVNQLACEVVSFVTNATPASRACEIWVKVPSVSYNVDTVIYVWYKNVGQSQPAATDPYGRNAVWMGYAVVSHDGGKTDSTGNYTPAKTGLPVNAMGKFTNATNYGTTSNAWYYDIVGTPDPSVALTQQVWIYPTSISGARVPMAIHDVTVTEREAVLIYGGKITQWDNQNGFIGGTTTPIANEWHSIAYTHNGTTNRKIFYDGALDVIDTTVLASNATRTRLTMGSTPNSSEHWAGLLCEVRYRLLSLSADWLATEYNNQSSPSTFAAPGTPEAIGGGSSLTLANTSHDLTNDDVVLSLGQSLGIMDSAHSQNTGNVTLAQIQSIAIMSSDHVMGGGVPNLSIWGGLALDQAIHSVTSDAIAIEQFQSLVAQNATHGLSSDQGTLYGPTSFAPHPDRTQTPQKSGQTVSPTTTGRTTIPTNNRTIRI